MSGGDDTALDRDRAPSFAFGSPVAPPQQRADAAAFIRPQPTLKPPPQTYGAASEIHPDPQYQQPAAAPPTPTFCSAPPAAPYSAANGGGMVQQQPGAAQSPSYRMDASRARDQLGVGQVPSGGVYNGGILPPPPASPSHTSLPSQHSLPSQPQSSSTQSPSTGAVIDHRGLPTYGMLAPKPKPVYPDRPPVYYDRRRNVMVHNRGALREALAHKEGYLENAPVRNWAEFTERQKARHVPASPRIDRRVLPMSQGYRLRILRVSDLPMHTTYDGRTFEFQLGVSLYDEANGTFYGNTAYSYGKGFDSGAPPQRNVVDIDFPFDVFWHTRISDPRCMAVVEVIMLERSIDGVVKGRYALGWAVLPLFQVGTSPAASAPQAVSLVSGTPRYLLLRSVYNEDLHAPKVLQTCFLTFQAESYPAFAPIMPLLPEDFLVTYTDAIPGLRRFDSRGLASTTIKQCISTLANPMIAQMHSIVLRRLQLALPIQLHELLMSLDYKEDMTGGQGVYTGALRYSIKVSVHNGRTFVGPSYNLQNISAMDVSGWKFLQVLLPDAVFDHVVGDVLTTIVVELMAIPPQFVASGAAPMQRLIGWTAFVPFRHISPDGSHADVAVGRHRYELQEPKQGLLLRDLPPLNWRALLGDRALHSLRCPMVEFQLFETGRPGAAPPQPAQVDTGVQAHIPLAPEPGPPAQVPLQVPQPQVAQQPESVPAQLQVQLYPRPPSEPQFQPHDPRMSVEGGQPPPSRRPSSATLQQLSCSVEVAPGTLVPHVPPGGDGALQGVAAQMQQQIGALAHAIDELKQERKSLRESLNLSSMLQQQRQREPSPERMSYPRHEGAGTLQDFMDDERPRLGPVPPEPGQAPPATPDEIQRLRDLPPTDHFGQPYAFAGAPVPPGPTPETAPPPRALLQQLHDAGMVDALPEDVQAAMRAQGAARPPSLLPSDLALEARDMQTASDIVLQMLSYRHHETLNAPSNLQSMFFTFQFYHFPPTTTDIAYLVQPKPPVTAPITTHQAGLHPASAAAAAADASSSTRILVTNNPMQRGAGVVVKYALDGSAGPLDPGQSPLEAAQEAHMAFASYLASHVLSLDVWDGDSLLQVGTASLDLAPLLRQGRPFTELLVELPVMLHEQQQLHAQQVPIPGVSDTKAPTILSRGSIVVRAINIGRPPRDTSTRAAEPSDTTRTRGAHTRLRVKPAWCDVHGPIARELANGDHPDVIELQQLQLGGGVGTPEVWGGDFGLMLDPQQQKRKREQQLQTDQDKALLVHNAIMARSSRKCARVRQLRNITETEKGEQQLSAPKAGEQYTRIQQQVLVDVAGARARKKHDFIREQLRKNMVTRQIIKPSLGEVVVYEYPLTNPFSHEVVFELRISSPTEVSILTRVEDYRALKAANVRFLGPGAGLGEVEPELVGGNRLYMRAHERVVLPLRVQTLKPPHGYVQAPTRVPGVTGPVTSPEHVVSLDIVSASSGHSVGVFELQIAPQPLIIDRTFRFYHPERELMRQSISLPHLTGSSPATSLPPSALRNLSVVANHPHVITSVGACGATGVPGAHDTVHIKYTCGPTPEVTQFLVVLYGDRLHARPLEVWQVFVHSLKKVDMRAMIGQTSAASVVVRGKMSSRRVTAYASHPDELQVSPDTFILVAGALTEITVVFKPVTAGPKDVKVHLVDVETRELVYALIVAAEGLGPLVTRTFEMEIPVGAVANKKISYTNPYPQFRTFTMRCNQPWLLQFTPSRLQLPGGATRMLGLTFDARAATTGILDVLVFVNDEDECTEECFKIRTRIFR